MVENKEEIPCMTSYCPPIQRELQLKRLNTFITKIKIKNLGDKDLYIYRDYNYLQNSERIEPNYGKTWQSFPRGATYEFELELVGRAETDVSLPVYFNDKPVFWDEVKFEIHFPSKFRKFKKQR